MGREEEAEGSTPPGRVEVPILPPPSELAFLSGIAVIDEEEEEGESECAELKEDEEDEEGFRDGRGNALAAEEEGGAGGARECVPERV